jgi:hypothetical protein
MDFFFIVVYHLRTFVSCIHSIILWYSFLKYASCLSWKQTVCVSVYFTEVELDMAQEPKLWIQEISIQIPVPHKGQLLNIFESQFPHA